MPRKKKEEAPVEVIKIEIERKPRSWTEKNNAMQAERYGGKEK